VNPVPQNAGGGNQAAGPSAPSGVGTVGDNNPQNPVRQILSAAIPDNSAGQSQVMQSGPTARNLGVFKAF
jgi:hypothetical protein